MARPCVVTLQDAGYICGTVHVVMSCGWLVSVMSVAVYFFGVPRSPLYQVRPSGVTLPSCPLSTSPAGSADASPLALVPGATPGSNWGIRQSPGLSYTASSGPPAVVGSFFA